MAQTSRRSAFMSVGAALAGAAPDAAPAGVVDRVAGSHVVVRLDGQAATVTARPQVKRRSLRAGDRVAVHRDGDALVASPLFFSARGTVDGAGADAIVVDGARYVVDERSVLHDGARHRALRAGDASVKPGAVVGVLCVENVLDRSLTVQAVYLGG